MGSKHSRTKAEGMVVDLHRGMAAQRPVADVAIAAQHRLDEDDVPRWRKCSDERKSLANEGELLREEQRERRRKRHHPNLSTDKRSSAVQAFWAMHVEAMTWSGMTAPLTADAHRICVAQPGAMARPFRSRRRRDRLANASSSERTPADKY